MLQPPPGMADAVRAQVRDQVNFLGQNLIVDGVPFMQQDTQLGRCAHAAAWMCHYAGHRRDGVARQPMADFSLAANPGLGYGRPLPSQGPTVQQLLELLRTFDLPASCPPRPVDTRLVGICCRYLNSGLPGSAMCWTTSTRTPATGTRPGSA
jgi:hypothetical protein